MKDYNKTDYPFHRVHEVANKFERIFNAPFQKFFDAQMSVFIFKHITIDIQKFDQYLSILYKDEYVDGVSMQAIVLKKYGYKGWRLIRDLIC